MPGPASFNTTCSKPATPALQTYLDSLPSGSVFRSSTTACYLVPDGIVLEHPITIIGGTFFDTSTQRPGTPYPYVGMQPIIMIKNTSDVSLEGVSVLGANTSGSFHPELVGEAGVKVESSSGVHLSDVTAKDTFGDGLELVADLTNHISTPVSGLTVNGYTTVDAGRVGITVAEVSDASITNVTIVDPADAGFDFESDIPMLGSGNVDISNCTDDHGITFVEYLDGPVTISNCSGFHDIYFSSPHSDAPVTFVGGSMSCHRASPVACIHQNGGSLTFDSTTITRVTGTNPLSEPVWDVEDGGSLEFDHSTIATPFGTAEQPSTVKFIH